MATGSDDVCRFFSPHREQFIYVFWAINFISTIHSEETTCEFVVWLCWLLPTGAAEKHIIFRSFHHQSANLRGGEPDSYLRILSRITKPWKNGYGLRYDFRSDELAIVSRVEVKSCDTC